ncbi:MAG: exo-alpha-sialidase [Verrucomicrobiota bacterium]
MSKVRVLVGTKKGAFILTSDGLRKEWKVEGPLFAGWEMYHLKGSPLNPDRIYASQTSGWFGQVIQRSDDGGKTWTTPDGSTPPAPDTPPSGRSNRFLYDAPVGTHMWYDGTQHPWEFKRVWHLEPSLTEPEVVYAGVEDAALFKSQDGGATWRELPALREAKGSLWAPGAGGMAVHTILIDPRNARRMFVAISAAGVFRTEDAGATWKPVNRGLKSPYELSDPDAEVGHCVHRIALHPSRPDTLFMQKHWDVLRSDNGGDQWTEVSGNLPSDFGFPIDVHAHEPESIYVVPITSDSLHYPPEGKLRVYRSRTGGGEWEPLWRGLPQQDCYVNVLRDAMAVDALDECGIYFGTTGGQVYASADSGETWQAIVRDLPAVYSVEVQTLP